MTNIIIHTCQGEYLSLDRTEYINHHGIKGQKWGVRRYQNPDGSLTSAGKKRISKKYKKAQAKGDKQLASVYNNLYVDAYNKTANYMNNNRIDVFNAEQKKKYGKDFAKRDGYDSDFAKEFDKFLQENFKKNLSEFVDNNANYQKAKSFVKQYGMLEWDSVAKENSKVYDEMHK